MLQLFVALAKCYPESILPGRAMLDVEHPQETTPEEWQSWWQPIAQTLFEAGLDVVWYNVVVVKILKISRFIKCVVVTCFVRCGFWFLSVSLNKKSSLQDLRLSYGRSQLPVVLCKIDRIHAGIKVIKCSLLCCCSFEWSAVVFLDTARVNADSLGSLGVPSLLLTLCLGEVRRDQQNFDIT